MPSKRRFASVNSETEAASKRWWTQGHYTEGAELIDSVLDVVRKDNQGFWRVVNLLNWCLMCLARALDILFLDLLARRKQRAVTACKVRGFGVCYACCPVIETVCLHPFSVLLSGFQLCHSLGGGIGLGHLELGLNEPVLQACSKRAEETKLGSRSAQQIAFECVYIYIYMCVLCYIMLYFIMLHYISSYCRVYYILHFVTSCMRSCFITLYITVYYFTLYIMFGIIFGIISHFIFNFVHFFSLL